MKRSSRFPVLLSFLLLSVVIAGCDVKKVKRQPHSQAVEVEYERNERLGQLNVDLDSIYKGREDFYKLVDTEPFNFAEVQNRILSPIGDLLLNEGILEDPEQRNRDEATTALRILNYAIFKAHTKAKDQLLASGILSRYKDRVFAGCNSEMKECRFFRFFHRDYVSSEILLFYARTLEEKIDKGTSSESYFLDIGEYYRVVHMSYSIRNGKSSESWNFAYLKYQSEYYENVLSKLPESEGREDQVAKHRNLVGYILIDLESRARNGGDNSQYCGYMDRINAFGQALVGLSEENRTEIARAVTGHINCLKANGTLKSKAEDLLEQSQNVDLPSLPGSVASNIFGQINILKNEAPVDMIKNFNVQTDISDPYAFIIIDRYFNEAFDLGLATELFKEVDLKNKEDMVRLLDTLRSYLTIHMLYLTHLSYKNMGDFYKNRVDRDYDSLEFFEDLLKGTVPINNLWTDYKKRADRVINFVISTIEPNISSFYDQDDSERRAIIKLYNDKKVALNELRKNINYIVVWPMQLIFMYHLAKYVDEKIEITSPYLSEPKEVKDGQVYIIQILQGVTDPIWFPYGDENRRLNKYETVIAFDYALKAGIFEYFQAAEGSSEVTFVTEKDWFEKYIEVWLQRFSNGLNRYATNIEGLLRGAKFKDFKSACENPSGFAETLDFVKDMSVHTFYPMLNKGSRSSGHFIQGFYHSNKSKINEVGTKLKQSIAYMNGYIDSFNRYMKSGLDKPDRLVEDYELIEQSIFENINNFQKHANNYMSVVTEAHEEIGDCGQRIVEHEYKRQKKLYDLEINFLKDVHAMMSLLGLLEAGSGASDSEMTSYLSSAVDTLEESQRAEATQYFEDVVIRMKNFYRSSVSLDDLKAEFMKRVSPQIGVDEYFSFVAGVADEASLPTQTRLTKDNYVYTKWALLLRLRNYMYGNDLNGEPLAPVTEIEIGAESQLEKKYSTERNHQETIRYNINQREFVTSAMSLLKGGPGTFISWLTSTANLVFMFDQIELETNLFKVKTVEVSEVTCAEAARARAKDPNSTLECEVKEFGAESIIEKIDALIRNMNLDNTDLPLEERDRYYLDWLDANSKYLAKVDYGSESKTLISLFLDPLSKDPRKSALFDYFYTKFMGSDLTGFGSENRLSDTLYFSRLSVDLRNRPFLLFPGYEEILDGYRPGYRQTVVDYFDLISQFEDVIESKEARDKSAKDSSDRDFLRLVYERVSAAPAGIELIDGEWIHITPKTRPDGTPIYLKESEKGWVDSYAKKYFIDDTRCGLLPRLGDFDLPTNSDQYLGLSCQEKYELWSERWE